MKKITAHGIFGADARIHRDKVLVVDSKGRIDAILPISEVAQEEVQFLDGLLVPGFINTHCHLELSHMKGRVDTGTGLLPFIDSVVKTRGATDEEIQAAIDVAEQEMYDTGIVAVGDISNQADTFRIKSTGRLRYYTFIECFDFMQDDRAEEVFEQYTGVFNQLELADGCRKSYVPHAPYSMSDRLYQLVRTANPDDCTISIHNQETPPENELFLTKTGGFLDFYNSFGISLDHFKPTGQTSIHSALPHLNPRNRSLFVHNTLTTLTDIEACHQFSENIFWTTCPNANLYIENKLPDYGNFLKTGARVTIGTDSLTSNWQLSILEEMKTIQRFQSYIPLETLLTWATSNGADALGFNDLGRIETGKTPGLVLITEIENGRLSQNSQARRIV